MLVTSAVPALPPSAIERMLSGLPEPGGYAVHVKPLRYRDRPHVSAWTDFEEKTITLQLPEPFYPFGEVVPYGAKRRSGPAGSRPRFIWLTEGITLRTPRDVLRFSYCHEWMHWWLKERRGTASAAETACDRFALWNFRRRTVTEQDALDAFKRREATAAGSRSRRAGGRRTAPGGSAAGPDRTASDGTGPGRAPR